MDQIKQALAAAKQHSFWVMCVGILALSLGSWYYATAQLDAQRDTQTKKIQGVEAGLKTLQKNNPLHPNETTNKGMEAIITAYSKEVAKGWEAQYERQLDVLKWPDTFGDDFRAAVNKYRPIEKLEFGGDVRSEIDVSYRRVYRDFIEQEIPTLTEAIGTEWTASSEGVGTGSGSGSMGGPSSTMTMPTGPSPSQFSRTGPGMSGTGAEEEVDTDIVAWLPASQQELFNAHFGFCARTEPPTTLEVLYAQEDIWVLNSLIQMIAATNGDAQARHDAAIKQIDFIRMGRDALGMVGQVTPIGTKTVAGDASTGAMPTGPSAMPTGPPTMPTGPQAMPTGPGGSTDPSGAAAAIDPGNYRYVDERFQPIEATKLRESLKSTELKDALVAVAKRMPIRIRLMMDQRKLNKLLTECGNAKLPLEVRQLRVNREPGVAGQTVGGMGGAGSMPSTSSMPTGPSPLTMPTGPGRSSGPQFGLPGADGNRGQITDSTVDANMLPVELYGVVYIYNPPNLAQLGLQDEAAGEPLDPAEAAAAPTVSSTEPRADAGG